MSNRKLHIIMRSRLAVGTKIEYLGWP